MLANFWDLPEVAGPILPLFNSKLLFRLPSQFPLFWLLDMLIYEFFLLLQILYMIRANKAFKMFPSDSELELARRISYERYDADRIIAHQGRPPDRFYYILSGKGT